MLIRWTRERLKESVALWNKELGEQFPMREELFEQNSFNDINVCYESSAVALDDEKNVIGFVVAKRWQDAIDVGIRQQTGWIQVLLVASHHRKKGIGKQLLQHAESRLRGYGKDHLWLGKDTWHYFPGIPAPYQEVADWFEMQGYVRSGEEFDLDNVYPRHDAVNVPAKDGVEVALLQESELDDFVSFLKRCFPGRWEYEARKYVELGGTGREFVVLKKHGRIIGFSRINDSSSPVIAQNVNWAPLYHGELGGIGPLGIDDQERGNGYGLYIVEAAIAYLRKRKVDAILIDWTGLTTFYEKLGFSVCKHYYSYEKDLVRGE